MHLPIRVDREQIMDFCRKHHIRKFAFFGSILREDFTENSDVDVLVEFAQNQEPGLMGLAGMEIELSAILGRKADIRTPEDLSEYFRDDVVREAFVQYAA